jgi:protease IV
MRHAVWTLTCAVLWMGGCMPSAILIQPVSARRELKEQVIQVDPGGAGGNKVAIIDVDGTMANSQRGGLFSTGDNPVSLFIEKLDRAAGDPSVKAVVLRINTPGGSVAAADSMYHALCRFRQTTQKPVVACMLDVAASGGYYLACGADGIMAQPSTVTGSIGVVWLSVNFAGTLEKIGAQPMVVKSGPFKDMGSPFKVMSDQDRQLIETMIQAHYEHFLAAVQAGRRDMTPERIRALADGRIFMADQAKKEGLIDRVGYPEDAIAWAKEKARLSRCKVVIYERPVDYKPNIYGSSAKMADAGALVNIDLPVWLRAEGPQFLYLWQPGL